MSSEEIINSEPEHASDVDCTQHTSTGQNEHQKGLKDSSTQQRGFPTYNQMNTIFSPIRTQYMIMCGVAMLCKQ